MIRFFKYSVIVLLILSIGIFMFMQQASFGKLPAGERLTRVEASPNYRDGKFQNLQPTRTIAEGVSYLGMMSDFFFSKGINREPISELPSVKTDLTNLPVDETTIIWFGHSSVLISTRGKNILVDPVFSSRPSPVQFAGSKSYAGTSVYNAQDLPSLDVIIITHDHYDHLDYQTILGLREKAALFCVPLGVGHHLEHWGIPNEKIAEFDWWDSKTILDTMQLISTPARHFSGRGFTRDKTLWSSYVLQTGSHNIFLGGDSGYDEAFSEIGAKYGPFDIALLECGQYDVKWPKIHMMPEETVQASIDLKAKVLMPIHWGKFTLGLHPWTEPVERALNAADSLNVTVTTPLIGEPVILGNNMPGKKWWR
jgi:L-ascorbate metabolism protein UlaG (beta-lactamase superfamily)